MSYAPFIRVDFHHFCNVKLYFSVFSTQVTWHYMGPLVRALDEDHCSSLISGGIQCNLIR